MNLVSMTRAIECAFLRRKQLRIARDPARFRSGVAGSDAFNCHSSLEAVSPAPGSQIARSWCCLTSALQVISSALLRAFGQLPDGGLVPSLQKQQDKLIDSERNELVTHKVDGALISHKRGWVDDSLFFSCSVGAALSGRPGCTVMEPRSWHRWDSLTSHLLRWTIFNVCSRFSRFRWARSGTWRMAI